MSDKAALEALRDLMAREIARNELLMQAAPVIDRLISIEGQIDSVTSKVEEANNQLAQLEQAKKDTEEATRRILADAELSATVVKATGKQTAEATIKAAKKEAEEIIDQANRQKANIEKDAAALKDQEEAKKAKIAALTAEHEELTAKIAAAKEAVAKMLG